MVMQNSNKADWKKNVKQVFRVALVGLEPSDQVYVKGYMRLLLRVDFDIEWVQPKHPKVNLFVVNHQFAGVDSVKQLIEVSNAPVLYTARHAEKSDTIENNTLYLSLKNVSILEKWLTDNISMIYDTFHAEDDLASANTTQTAPASLVTKNIAQPSSFSGQNFTDAVVTFINKVNNIQSDSYFEIKSNLDVIAILKPKERIVWPKGDTFFPDYSLEWQIQEIPPQNLQTKHAMNLSTWVWQCAQDSNSQVHAILPKDAKLQLRTWPKPKNNADKSDYLRICALTELSALSVNDIVRMTGIAADKVHRCLGALYLAGFMDTGMITLDVFVKQQLREHNAKSPKPITQTSYMTDPISTNIEDNSQITTRKSTPKVIATGAEVAEMVNSSVDSSIEKPVDSHMVGSENMVKQKGFGGLLSRIRSTLGL